MTDRALKAGAWTFAFRSAARGIGFARNIALARILAPEDIGLFGIVLVILSILERFTETGFKSALVQKKDDVRDYLDSAWTVLALRRIALAGLIVATAPWVASFFGEARATPLIQLLGLSIFIQAFGNVAVVQFKRELEMKRQYIHIFSGTIADLLISVSFAIYLRNAWALMLGLVAGRLVSVIVSYLVHSYRPRLRLDWAQTRELSRFGRWVFLKNILTFLSYRGDNLVVAKVLGAPALGVYMLAYSISEVVTVEIARITNNVAFPAYSRKQGDLQAIRAGFLTATELVAAASFPVAVGIAILAGPLTLLLLGERWLEVAGILPPLALAGCFRAIVANGTSMSSGLGHPQHGFQRGLVQIAVMYAAMAPLIVLYGLQGLAYAVLLGSLGPIPLLVRNSAVLIGVRPGELLRSLVPAGVLGLVVAAVLIGTAGLGPAVSAASLLARVALTALALLLVAAVMWHRFRCGPLRIPIMMIQRSRARRGGAVPRSGAALPVR